MSCHANTEDGKQLHILATRAVLHIAGIKSVNAEFLTIDFSKKHCIKDIIKEVSDSSISYKLNEALRKNAKLTEINQKLLLWNTMHNDIPAAAAKVSSEHSKKYRRRASIG